MMDEESQGKAAKRASPGIRSLTTQSVAPRVRFELWRSQFKTVDMKPRRRPWDAPFRGELTQWVGRMGVSFSHLRVDALENRYRAGGAEGLFLLTWMAGGRVEMSDSSGWSLATNGGLFLTDTSRRMSIRHSRYSIAYLGLPRALVLEALGGDPLPARGGLPELSNQGLGPFVSAQLRLLCEHGPGLGSSEREAATDATVDLALAFLRERLQARSADPGPTDRGLFTAATLYIEHHLHRADLSPAQVARALGCSRARLYRLFAERDLGVSELIRDLRLKRSCELLRQRPLEAIGSIAVSCGYLEPSTFNRAFRRRYGMSPGELRGRALEPADTPAAKRGAGAPQADEAGPCDGQPEGPPGPAPSP